MQHFRWITCAFVLAFTLLFSGCGEGAEKQESINESQTETHVKFHNQAHELVYQMTQKVGDYEVLRSKEDVIYTYTYTTPDGKTDISTEKYIFDGELSYGEYRRHERTLPELEGTIEQGYDGEAYWVRHNGTLLDDEAALKRAAFSRPTNFYWFAMFQKLLDPGVQYAYLGEVASEDRHHDIVKISFESTDDKPTDTYQLYINRETGLADQFLFTVADFGVIDTPYLMQMEYEEVDGLLIPTRRKYKKSTWEAAVTDEPWIEVLWSDIKFNNGLSPDDFAK